MESTTASLKRF